MSKQQDKTCVPPVEATEEQRETLHMKAIGEHKETKIEYELLLRRQDEDELIVDVRKDIVDLDGYSDDGGEYIEGFSFEGHNFRKNYGEAVTKFLELRLKYPDANEYDEILEEATDLLAIRYGNGIYEIVAEVDTNN